MQAPVTMKPSTRIAVGIAILIAVLFVAGLSLYFLPVLDQRFHFLSEHAQQIAAEYDFRLLGFLLLVFAPFCALLEAVWWVGRKLKIPYIVLLLACLALIVIGHFWLAYQFKGTIRG
ncbi:MAG: hypothetical protein LAP21_03635 [Acidobacteriia bacterium]|nr:hypothetical protein [Terriglobia bacterium]